jgi:excisionase family DNA binding protein
MMNSKPQRETLTLEETATLLGVSSYTIYEQARTGAVAGVPVIRVGRRILVPRRALERVLGYPDEDSIDTVAVAVEPPSDTQDITPQTPAIFIELRIVIDTRTGAVSCERPTVVTGQDCS